MPTRKPSQNNQGRQAAPAQDGDIISCSIKLLPQDQWVAAAETAVRVNPANHVSAQQFTIATGQVLPPEHLAVLVGKKWPSSGVHLTVGFIETVDAALRARIVSHMNAWGAYCNATFSEVAANAQVRISLAGDGYWSYLGTDILHIPAGEATMNLQNFSMSTPESEYHRVVRHETGHTLGFPHEHLRAEIVNRIDPNKAKAYFLANDGWDAATVTAQVLTPLDNSALLATAHADPTSIMCYWLPGSIMKDGVAVTGGSDIDSQDQAFAATVYPKPKSAVKDVKDAKHEHKEAKVEKVEKNEKVEHKEKIEKTEHKDAKIEKVEKHEQKEAKIEKVEHKDAKIEKVEKNEHKEVKIEKNEKEIKEKNEHKEAKIELKEIKEKNELIEHKIPDKINEGPVGPGPLGGGAGAYGGQMMMSPGSGSLAARVQQLEASVGALTSFIDASLRPDLSGGALRNE